MISKELARISQSIEQLNTDHYTKFCLYMAVLDNIGSRGQRSFEQSLPKHSTPGFFGPTVARFQRPVGLYSSFSNQVVSYSLEYDNTEPSITRALSNVVSAFMGRGKMKDLSFLIEKLSFHAQAINLNALTNNRELMVNTGFAANKAGIAELIKEFNLMTQQVFILMANVRDTALSWLVFFTALSALVYTVSSLGIPFLSAPCAVGALYAAQTYKNQTKDTLNGIEVTFNNLADIAKNLDPEAKKVYLNILKPMLDGVESTTQHFAFDRDQVERLRETRDERFLAFSN